jgi:hypothetical protein
MVRNGKKLPFEFFSAVWFSYIYKIIRQVIKKESFLTMATILMHGMLFVAFLLLKTTICAQPDSRGASIIRPQLETNRIA